MADTTTKKPSKPDILYISGSPRARTSEALVTLIEKGAKSAGARGQHFFLSNKRIAPCVGCGFCSKTGTCVLASKTMQNRLIDDYLEFHALLERADALVIVAPLYFAGPSSQFKAMLDRLQPYWAKRYVLGEKPKPKRPAQLFVVGAGGDAHGQAPLVGITKSALAVAGFNLEKVHTFVGFKAKKDVPVLPPEDQRDKMALGELAYLRRELAAQTEFEQRAINAGGAFARYLEKIHAQQELQSKLQLIEAEIEAFRTADEEVTEVVAETKYYVIDKAYEINKAFEELRGEITGLDGDTPEAAIAEAFNARAAEKAAEISAEKAAKRKAERAAAKARTEKANVDKTNSDKEDSDKTDACETACIEAVDEMLENEVSADEAPENEVSADEAPENEVSADEAPENETVADEARENVIVADNTPTSDDAPASDDTPTSDDDSAPDDEPEPDTNPEASDDAV
ncbi:MAG: NAD(P)H-dependent oxidoreductase [Coriobacteriia bacterium]|nr:NAD(P)H-dependent oxidoreductase [Coriobacteriia bacterium]